MLNLNRPRGLQSSIAHASWQRFLQLPSQLWAWIFLIAVTLQLLLRLGLILRSRLVVWLQKLRFIFKLRLRKILDDGLQAAQRLVLAASIW